MSIDTIDTKKKMLEALEATLGIVSEAASMIGIHRTTHYLWMNSDPEYKAAVESIDDLVLDLSESALHKNIKAGDPASIFFHLKTKGKRRGYIERQQVETRDVTKFEDLTDEELDAKVKELE
jgi:hypothetical protein